jgi:multiple sugar transport system substrate-binding protein
MARCLLGGCVVVALLVAPLFQRGPASAAPSPAGLRFGIYADPAREVAARAQAEAFNRTRPGSVVNVEPVPYADYYRKLGIAMTSGDAWDLFMINGAYFQQVAPENALLPLSDRIKKAGLKLLDYTIDPVNGEHNAMTYALPYELNMTALFYNKDLFDAARVGYPTDKWTWNDLLRAAKALTRTEGGRTVQWGFFSELHFASITNFLAQNGTSILDRTRSTCRLTDPAAVEALQFMVDFVQTHKVSPLTAELPTGVNPFMTGRVAMVISYSFSVQPTLKAPFKWGVAPLPMNKRRGYAYWTQAVAIYPRSKNVDAAWEFAVFLMSKEAQELMARQRGATPSLKSVARSPIYTERPPDGMDVFAREYQVAGVPVQFTDKFFETLSGPTSPLVTALAPAWNGQMRVADAAARACAEINRVMTTR